MISPRDGAASAANENGNFLPIPSPSQPAQSDNTRRQGSQSATRHHEKSSAPFNESYAQVDKTRTEIDVETGHHTPFAESQTKEFIQSTIHLHDDEELKTEDNVHQERHIIGEPNKKPRVVALSHLLQNITGKCPIACSSVEFKSTSHRLSGRLTTFTPFVQKCKIEVISSSLLVIT